MEAALTRARPFPRRRLLATAGVALAAVAFFAVVANQALVSALLIAAFGTARDPVFPTPLLTLTLQHLAIVAISSGLTLLVGLPLGVWVTRESGRDFRDIVSASVRSDSNLSI